MRHDIHLTNISELNELILNKSINLQEVISSCYERVGTDESEIQAWKFLTPIESHNPPAFSGPLSGLCLGVKDIIATREAPTLMGTNEETWKGTQGSFDARVISKIRSSGATIIGKYV